MDWRIETPNSADALKKTLTELSREGYSIHSIISGGSGIAAARRFTVVAYRQP